MNWGRLTAVAVLSTMVFTLATSGSSAANDGIAGKNKAIDKKEKQLRIHSKITKASNGNSTITWNEKKGVPNFVTGKVSTKKLNNAGDAVAIMEENRGLFDMSSAVDELNLIEQSQDELGKKFMFKQTYKGIPVFGNELILHADTKGNAISINGYYDPEVKIKGLKTKPKISASQAVETAKHTLGLDRVKSFDIIDSKLNILQTKDGKHRLVYLVTLSTLEGEPVYADVFVDAHDGKVVKKINKMEHTVATGTGTGVLNDSKTVNADRISSTYYLRDITKPMYRTGGKIETYTAKNGTTLPGTLLTDTDNVWIDKAAVDAHVYGGMVYDYYYNKLGRNSYDNNGATIKATVHYSKNYNNAFWNGTQMVYGDGDATQFLPLSGSLDIVAHEITHAVTERTAGLIYEYQSGALNESWSDVFGNLIENKADNLWLIGEGIYTPITSGDALRSMSNPSAYGDPGHMSQYVNTTADNGGVHTNSGIPNKAFYNFVTTTGVTRDNAGKVWYRALTQYLTSNSQFIDARTATIQAATDLFGAGSTEVAAVTNAWTNVGVGGSTGGGGTVTDSYEPNETPTSAYGNLASGTTYNALVGSSTDNDWFKFDLGTTGAVTVSLGNLAKDYDLYLYNSAGTEVAKSWNSGTMDESISYNATATGTYYVKVASYNGESSTAQAYSLKVNYPTGTTTGAQWYYEAQALDTPHPYANNYNNGDMHTYSRSGAQKVALHFSAFATESNYDYVYIKDKNGNVIASHHGNQTEFWAIIDGDQITANLVSDGSVTANGYTIDQVGYYATTPLAPGARTTFAQPIEGK